MSHPKNTQRLMDRLFEYEYRLHSGSWCEPWERRKSKRMVVRLKKRVAGRTKLNISVDNNSNA